MTKKNHGAHTLGGYRRSGPGFPMDRQEAIRRNLWGFRWASIAEEAGFMVAGAEALPPSEEAQAQRIAKSLASTAPPGFDRWDFDRSVVAEAILAWQATIPSLRRMLSPEPVSEREQREISQLLHSANQAGRTAAIAVRIYMLLLSDLDRGK